MDKIIRSVNELLWRKVKAQSALEGKNMTEWVEEVIEQALTRPEVINDGLVKKYKSKNSTDTTKIIRNMNEELWRKAKAQAALSGKSMKDWVENIIANGLNQKKMLANSQKSVKFRSNSKSRKTKLIRNINEQLWREAKACAALDGKTMKDWVEGIIAKALVSQETPSDDVLKKLRSKQDAAKTKILRNVDEQLWREVKARAALDGKSMKDWVEGVIALTLSKHIRE